MLELKGESQFKVRAYRTAASTFANLHEDLKEVWREGRVDDLPGVGKAITDKVGELMTTGHLRFYERLLEEIPPSLISLTEIPHLGPKTAMFLYQNLGIQGMADLEKALDDGRLRELPGFGEKTIESIREGIAPVQSRSADKRELLGTALPIVRQIIALLKQRCPSLQQIEAAGSTRRWKPTVGDTDIMATATDSIEVIDSFGALPRTARFES